MSFGRWLLVHSFSIALLMILLLGYVYRSELQLEKAYHQLMNFENESSTQVTDAILNKQAIETTVSDETVLQSDTVPKISVSEKAADSKQRVTNQNYLSTVPTISGNNQNQQEQGITDERLYQARQAYWDKNYKQAIYLYRQLIQENRFNPDFMGELGNIYYSLNDYENASMLYYQAALQLIELNELDLASSLIAPVYAMNRELGEKLKLKLQ